MAIIQVSVHSSQFPAAVRRELKESLRSRRIGHKFHYDSIKQATQWLALHEKYSPARTDRECAAIYEAGFQAVAEALRPGPVHLIGLGCGGGGKDVDCLQRLTAGRTGTVTYSPCDVSTALVLTAAQAAGRVVGLENCRPLVIDLETSRDSAEVLRGPASLPRVITFFGMLPNFEPEPALSKLAEIVGREDQLLLSANLAPGTDYDQGMARVLPLYENDLTREWLLTFLWDLGMEREAGDFLVEVEPCPQGSGLKRLAAHFRLKENWRLRLDEELFEFKAGEALRLFFSYRHTPEKLAAILRGHGLGITEQWVTSSGEEGVFLCRVMDFPWRSS
jgi:L-histidine Nalpha-methyltransferase